MTQLYEENFGNALGSALGNGVQVFQQRQDQLDEKNYTRAQAKTANQKQEAQTLYNHLKDLTNSFRDVQAKGGQQGMSSLDISQAGDSLNKANKIMGLLTSGKYDEAQQAFGDFQSHMDAVAGPGPTDSSGAAVSGPAAPVAGTGTFSSADILNNQIGAGNQLLGSLAYRGTKAQTGILEGQLVLTEADAGIAKEKAALTIRSLTATTTVEEVNATIANNTKDLKSAAQVAEYLGTIADQGGIGAQAASIYLKTAPVDVQKAFAARSQQADTARATTVEQASTNLGISRENLMQISEQRPWLLASMKWQNALQAQTYGQTEKMNPLDVEKARGDIARTKFELERDQGLAPLQKSLLTAQVGTQEASLAILDGTKAGVISGTNSQNYAILAENNQVDDFKQMVAAGTMTQKEADLWIALAGQKDALRKATLDNARNVATTSGVAARVQTRTEGDQVLGVKYQTNLLGSQAAISRADSEFRVRANARTVEGQALDNKGKAITNFTAGVTAKYAEPMAAATLAATQGDAASRVAAGQVAKATVGTEIAGAKAKLQGTLLDNTGKALTNNLVRATFAAQVKKYSLDNELTSSNIASNYFQIARSKALLPGEIAAQGAALEYNKAQSASLLKAASDKGDRAEQTKILQQQRIISDGDLKDAQLAIARLIPSAKFGVDQFDPSNYSTMTAKLSEEQKGQLVDAIDQYNGVMKTRKDINGQLSSLLTGNVSLPGGATSTGTGAGRAMTAPPGFKALSDSAAKKAGVNPAAFYGFLGAESSFGTNVSNYAGMDYVGAGQIGQAAQDDVNKNFKLNLDRNIPEQNMELAARYYKLISARLKTQDPMVIYAAYNWGAGNVQKHLAANGGRLTLDGLPDETRTGLNNMGAALRGYGSDKGGEVPTGTAQNASQTTSAPFKTAPQTGVPKGGYKAASTGATYTSPTLQPGQWIKLDSTGFFGAAQKLKSGDEVAFIKKFGSILYGPKPTQDQLAELYRIAQTAAK